MLPNVLVSSEKRRLMFLDENGIKRHLMLMLLQSFDESYTHILNY